MRSKEDHLRVMRDIIKEFKRVAELPDLVPPAFENDLPVHHFLEGLRAPEVYSDELLPVGSSVALRGAARFRTARFCLPGGALSLALAAYGEVDDPRYKFGQTTLHRESFVLSDIVRYFDAVLWASQFGGAEARALAAVEPFVRAHVQLLAHIRPQGPQAWDSLTGIDGGGLLEWSDVTEATDDLQLRMSHLTAKAQMGLYSAASPFLGDLAMMLKGSPGAVPEAAEGSE